MITQHSAEVAEICTMLREWLRKALPTDAFAWVTDKSQKIAAGADDWVFFTSFSAVPRYTGKADLRLDANERQAASHARTNWHPENWSVDQAARALMALSLPNTPVAPYIEKLEKVFNAADIGESVVLYQILPLYPHPEKFVDRAAEGLRSNMTSVFEAVALRNPFPAEYFEENAWNQLVLKSCFVGSTLHRIMGLDARANATLAEILVDYAHERWAAGRVVTPELWRPVGPFATDNHLADLQRVLEDDDPVQQEAGALALSQSPATKATTLLASRPDLQARIEAGTLTWDTFSAAHLA
ncbi:MAG: EboA domain-containing protein [Bacteroidota bacterium]